LINEALAIAERRGVRRFPRFLRNAAHALVLGGLLSLHSGCGSSPWEQGSSGDSVAVTAARAVEHEFFAGEASMGKWIDERPSGSVIRHGMLIVHEPEVASTNSRPRGRFIITSTGPELQTKISDIVADRIPIAAGLTTNFALGRAIQIRIERADVNGHRELVHEGPVAFLELTR
jgi:hypothetical protein